MKKKRKHHFILKTWSTITDNYWEDKSCNYEFIIDLKTYLEKGNYKCLLSVR